MKTLKIFTLMLLIATGAAFSASAQNAAQTKKETTQTVVYDVSIHCNNCKAKVEKHIPFEKGVKDVAVDVQAKTVTVKFDPRKTDKATLQKAIEALGYTASERTAKK